jgi:UDP-GlcNAc:undecaprenyl-phosphate GlcNAc-1-phosphate transferase
MEIFFIFLFITVFNLLIFLKFDLISKNFIFFDKPDGRLKKHSKPVSLIGGLIVLVNLYFIIFSLKLLNLDNLVFEKNFIYGFIFLSTAYYFIGLVDDLKNLSPNKKLFFLFVTTLVAIYFFSDLKLEHIKISFLKEIYYFKFSEIFLILSFTLLANSMNMFDGINLQLILFSSFLFFLFALKGFMPIFFILLLICFIFLAILNYKSKVFLGDSGAYLISIIIGCTFIYQYNNYSNHFFGDEVFIILIIPAIDMLRLFFMRIIKKKHPFKGDLNHLHHIVNNFTKNKTLTILITITLSIIPSLMLMLNMHTYIILILSIIIYLSLISYLRFKV